jgi:hypothetical protein
MVVVFKIRRTLVTPFLGSVSLAEPFSAHLRTLLIVLGGRTRVLKFKLEKSESAVSV